MVTQALFVCADNSVDTHRYHLPCSSFCNRSTIQFPSTNRAQIPCGGLRIRKARRPRLANKTQVWLLFEFFASMIHPSFFLIESNIIFAFIRNSPSQNDGAHSKGASVSTQKKSGLQLNKSVRPLFDDLVDLSQEDIDAFCAPAARFKRPLQGPHSPCRPARSRTLSIRNRHRRRWRQRFHLRFRRLSARFAPARFARSLP